MKAFQWAMRYGAGILFAASLLIFVITFASYLFVTSEAYGQVLSTSGLTNSKFVAFWGALAQALSHSAWSFLGACLLYRLDQHWSDAQDPRK